MTSLPSRLSWSTSRTDEKLGIVTLSPDAGHDRWLRSGSFLAGLGHDTDSAAKRTPRDSVHPINSSYIWSAIGVPLWDASQCLIELAKAARGTVVGDQLVYAEKIEFGLRICFDVILIREVGFSRPIRGS